MNVSGVVNILKPPGMTSHDVVDQIRKVFKTKKVGHTGTLDPAAAGVLPITIGRATKISQYITSADKVYRAEITLGIKTDTLDSEGQVIRTQDASSVTELAFTKVLSEFIGDIQQIPPMASAIKIGGKKLYDLQRQGIEVERPARNVSIYNIKLVWSTGWGTSNPRALFDVHCSKGTYIRTLCDDIGEKLGVGAYMSFLLRTGVGFFNIENTVTIESLINTENAVAALIPMDEALSGYPEVFVRDKAIKAVLSGAKLYPPGVQQQPENINAGQLVRLKGNNNLLALAETQIEIEPEQRLVYKPICMLQI
jgi:tRNA pseudouridine55 synthase